MKKTPKRLPHMFLFVLKWKKIEKESLVHFLFALKWERLKRLQHIFLSRIEIRKIKKKLGQMFFIRFEMRKIFNLIHAEIISHFHISFIYIDINKKFLKCGFIVFHPNIIQWQTMINYRLKFGPKSRTTTIYILLMIFLIFYGRASHCWMKLFSVIWGILIQILHMYKVRPLFLT